jgi:hypothetical protein
MLCRTAVPRFVTSAVVAEFAAILRQYGVTEVWGGAFAGGFHAGAWADQRIKFKPAERSTSENYLRFCRSSRSRGARTSFTTTRCAIRSLDWSGAHMPATARASRTPPRRAPTTMSQPPLLAPSCSLHGVRRTMKPAAGSSAPIWTMSRSRPDSDNWRSGMILQPDMA